MSALYNLSVFRGLKPLKTKNKPYLFNCNIVSKDAKGANILCFF